MKIKGKQRKKEEEENLKYTKFIEKQNNFLMKDTKDKVEQRIEALKSVQADNFELSKQNKEKCEVEKETIGQIEKEVVSMSLSCPLLGETTTRRGDHFKGFNKEKLKDILRGNQQVLHEKSMIMQQQEQYDNQWATYERNVQRHRETENIMNQLKVKERNNMQAEILKAQKDELAQKQKKMEIDKFGAIEDGFFNKFGTSCR